MEFDRDSDVMDHDVRTGRAIRRVVIEFEVEKKYMKTKITPLLQQVAKSNISKIR